MTTFTAASYRRQPPGRDGLNAVVFRIATGDGVWGSVGDVVLLAKIPNKAQILDFAFSGRPGSFSSGASCNVILYVSTGSTSASDTHTVVRSGASISAASGMITPNSAFGFPKISLSDDSSIQYSTLKLFMASSGNNGTPTASFSLAGMLIYTMSNTED